MKTRGLAGFLAMAGVLCAGGGSSGGSGKGGTETTPPNPIEIKTSSMTVPAGGTAHITFTPTSPQPIMSGGTGFAAFGADGVALHSSLGESAGVAFQTNGGLQTP